MFAAVILILSTGISNVTVSHFSCLHGSSFASLILFSYISMKPSLFFSSYKLVPSKFAARKCASYTVDPFTAVFDEKFQMLEI